MSKRSEEMIWNAYHLMQLQVLPGKESKHFTCHIDIKIATQLKHNNHDKNR